MLSLTDDPAAWARHLGVSRDAIDLFAASEVVDLHVESFIWTRVFGYELRARHDTSLLGHRYWGQADVPRMQGVGQAAAVMSIATNPLRPARRRAEVLLANLDRLTRLLTGAGAVVVTDAPGYRQARRDRQLACFLALQGGNALEADDLFAPALDPVSRITLVHLTRSSLGATSAPGGRGGALTPGGHRFVEAMRVRSVILDLAHASPSTFWGAMAAHGRDVPVIASHTGVRAERRSWRNLDDEQIRAVAGTGGVVGVMFHRGFLVPAGRRARSDDVVRHLEHVVRVGGEGAAAIGSDFDGLILPPRDLTSVTELPRLVQRMLERRWSPELITKVLGANYLRVVEAVRPGTGPVTRRGSTAPRAR